MHENETERGSVLITVAAVLVTLVFFLALAIDVGVGYAERRKMQNAADAASLAAAWVLAGGGTDAQIRSAVNEYTIVQNEAGSFVAKYIPGGEDVGSGSLPSDATGVQVTAIGSAPTFIAGMIGFNQMTASALGGGGFSPLDIALVMDRSGSMDDDNCDLKGYCPSSDPRDTNTCAQCRGAWSNGACNINPFPARCGALNQTNCENCRGIWDTSRPPQPITDARAAAASFVDRNNPRLSHLAVVSYSTSGALNRTLTNDLQAVKNAVNAVGQPYPSGCTNAADGIKKAREELLGTRKRVDAVRFIIFLTDGLPNYPQCSSCPSQPNGCPAAMSAVRNEAAIAAQNAIVIYTIGLGTSADTALLQNVADLTGGEFFYAPSSSDLMAIYATIFEKIKLRLVQ